MREYIVHVLCVHIVRVAIYNYVLRIVLGVYQLIVIIVFEKPYNFEI